jgi:hypothetical protein
VGFDNAVPGVLLRKCLVTTCLVRSGNAVFGVLLKTASLALAAAVFLVPDAAARAAGAAEKVSGHNLPCRVQQCVDVLAYDMVLQTSEQGLQAPLL